MGGNVSDFGEWPWQVGTADLTSADPEVTRGARTRHAVMSPATGRTHASRTGRVIAGRKSNVTLIQIEHLRRAASVPDERLSHSCLCPAVLQRLTHTCIRARSKFSKPVVRGQHGQCACARVTYVPPTVCARACMC